MYKSFRVKNFRCFKDLQINDLGRVNLIAGKNNTGKTALMEALYSFTRPLSPQVLFELQQVRTEYVPNEHASTVWRQFFPRMVTAEDIELSARETTSEDSTYLTIKELARSEENAEAFLKYFQYLTAHGVPAAQANGFTTRAGAMLEFVHVDEDGTVRDTHFLPESPIPVNTEVEHRSLFVPICGSPNKEVTAAQFSNADMRGDRPLIERMLKIFEPQLTELRLQSP